MAGEQAQSSAEGYVAQLEAERDRLSNAVVHLVSSNDQLRCSIKDSGPDAVMKEALEVTIGVTCVSWWVLPVSQPKHMCLVPRPG